LRHRPSIFPMERKQKRRPFRRRIFNFFLSLLK